MKAILNFNSEATSLLNARGRARVEFKDDSLRMRPTDRKAGPHVLSDFTAKGKGSTLTIEGKQFDKLAAMSALTDGAEFHVAKDKYGWLALKSGDAPEGSENAGAKVTVKVEEEAAAA